MRRWWAAICAAVLVLGGCDGDDGEREQSKAAESGGAVRLRVAANDPDDSNIAVLAFLPARATVATGAQVEWSFAGPEPHSVTFMPNGAGRPAADEVDRYYAPRGRAGRFDGSTLVSSGVRPFRSSRATPFRLRFARAGQYSYICVIHAQMTGEITVTDDATATTRQEDLTARGDQEYAGYLAEGRAAKQALVATGTTSAPGPDGTPTWTIEMGTSTAHTAIQSFAPASPSVKMGDRITFVNNSASPHTASFGGTLVPRDPTSRQAVSPSPGPSPQPLLPAVFLSTGVLPPGAPSDQAAPAAERTYTYVPTQPGRFTYVCIVHRSAGMTGTITVA